MRHALCLALVVSVAAGCAGREGHVYRVPSSAMEPTLHCARPAFGCLAGEEDRVFVRPYEDGEPARDDIVVFEAPPKAKVACGASGLFIKRVIGLPGEHWAERSGTIVIDGRNLAEAWLRPDRRDTLSYGGGEIPRGHYLLLGDNRASSCDSRQWGLVPLANFRGKVVEIKRGSRRIHLR
ncbi:MAG: signal peptidase I [Gaiellaceae bacterium]